MAVNSVDKLQFLPFIIMYRVQSWNSVRAVRDTRQSWPMLLSWKTVFLMIWN